MGSGLGRHPLPCPSVRSGPALLRLLSVKASKQASHLLLLTSRVRVKTDKAHQPANPPLWRPSSKPWALRGLLETDSHRLLRASPRTWVAGSAAHSVFFSFVCV
jgi:hypothetical protein